MNKEISDEMKEQLAVIMTEQGQSEDEIQKTIELASSIFGGIV